MRYRLKLVSFLTIFLGLRLWSFAQPLGNEWINYSQKYYRIPVTLDGLYRINYSTLQNSGFPVNTINPRNIQLFGRGQEQHIYIEGEADGVFNTGDYIEFYGQGNDGWLDSLAFNPASDNANPYYSLFNDTAQYYMTWNNTLFNLRMTVETDTVNFNLFNPEPFCWKQSLNAYHGLYYAGETNAIAATDPEYTAGEGYFSDSWILNNSRTESHYTRNAYSSGPSAIIKANLIGASNAAGSINDQHSNIQCIGSSVFTLADFVWDGYQVNRLQYTVPVSQLNSNITQIKFNNIPTGAPHQQYNCLAFSAIEYPHTFDFEGAQMFQFRLPVNNTQIKSLLNITNFIPGAGVVRMYDLTNHRRINVSSANGFFRILTPNLGNEKHCILIAEQGIQQISQLYQIGQNGFFTDYLTSGNGSNYLIITHKSLLNEAGAYAQYRNLSGYNSLVVDIEELYDQFVFGIRKNPLALRRFCSAAVTQWSQQPQQLFIIGKAITSEQCRNSVANYALNLVPTYGYPPSDILLTARIPGTINYEPGIPIGRLAAKNDNDINAYRNKVIQHESQLPALWMKNILHFAGGFDASSQATLKYYLEQYEHLLEDTLFGGRVTTFGKTSSAPIQITASDSIRNLIESGVSVMTFFGHAAGSGFDQNIDDPNTYSWNGKYPLLVANSCFVGNIHLPPGQYITASENFVLSPGVGTIGFLANIGSNVPLPLYDYTRNFFRNLTQSHYGEGVGKAMQEAIKTVQTTSYDLLKAACLEMTLHGDPAIDINTHDLPDYALSSSGVYTIPANVTTDLDSFLLKVVVSNIGKAIHDSIIVEVKRILPDGSTGNIFSKLVRAPLYADTITFRINTDPIHGAGLNSLAIFADASNKIAEIDEINNRIQVNFIIKSEDINPVYPYNFAIYPKPLVTLKASTSDPFSAPRNYRFQMDTSDMFVSPIAEGIVYSAGGVVNWSPGIILSDSTVYYWRVSRDSVSGSGYRWRESSFQFINGKTGWAQAHFFQFKNDEYTFINYNRSNRRFEFVPNSRMLTCRTYSAPPGLRPTDTDLYATEFKLDSEVQDYAGCQYTPNLHVAVIDSLTLQSWGKRWLDNNQTPPLMLNPTHGFGNLNDLAGCRNQMEKYFIFQSGSPAQVNGMKNMLTNGVPTGHYILVYSWIRGNSQSIADTSVFSVLESMGADSLRYIADDRAYIFLTQKGNPAFASEVYSPPNGFHEITLAKTLTSNWNSGAILSTLIGPASRWDSLHWRQRPLESPTKDSIYLQVYGIRHNGQTDTLIHHLGYNNRDITLNGIADASTYPFLQLKAVTSDDSLQTAAQMIRWQVIYEEVPEAAVNPNKHFSFHSAQLNEGDIGSFSCAVENVSSVNMDSLLIKFWFEDRNRMVHNLTYPRQDSLLKGDTMHAKISFPTRGFYGNNLLWMEVNPRKPGTNTFDQPEQSHFNNFATVAYTVAKDNTNPLLDVTFDGIHILDGDIVSAKPAITIKLRDENKYIALQDTSLFAVYMKGPSDQDPFKIHFSGGSFYEMKFVPAVLPDNNCKAELNPVFAMDGMYELMVQARDASGNLSGDYDYRVRFEVINRSSITEVMNYPNPFSTSTRFVFTLTGSRIPDEFSIRILTISGKVVREISAAELGPIRIGRNITAYAWDGRDEFGDLLANGIYLYKVFIGIDGEQIEKRVTNADQYFKKGYGKMVLIR